MEYNLKNRPTCEDEDSIAALIIWLTESREWFDGFEKELREMTKKFEGQPIYIEDVIKEILGE